MNKKNKQISLEFFKSSELNNVYGSTVIEHKIRVKLKLTPEEYVVLDYIHKRQIANKDFDKGLRGNTGYKSKEEILPILKSLKEKGLYEFRVDNDGVKKRYVTKKYQIACKIETDDSFEEFDMFVTNRTK